MADLHLTINGGHVSVPVKTRAVAALAAAGLNLKGADKPIAARLNGELIDLNWELTEDGRLGPVTAKDPQALALLRHSAAHVMAEAVKALFPEVKVTIGPAVENGFYYDFDAPEPFTPEDLGRIEEKMKKIIKAGAPFVRREISVPEALDLFRSTGETYKVELIEDLVKSQGLERVSIYESGAFTDLCRGPHLPGAGYVPAFKLLSVAGAYWRGDENRRMLQRVYGTAFFDKKELADYLALLEEAKKRDHRRLGKELDLFSIQDEVGGGLVIWHPKGALLRVMLEEFERREHLRRGYEVVMGPQILKADLWKKSGHWDNYRENMYFTEVDGQLYGLKPMNCLAHMYVYKSRLRSWRDLPLRLFELGTVHRHEKSGVLHGLTRVRQFTQDDAHILCAPDQVNSEIKSVLDFVTDLMGAFGFEYEMELSTRPEKSIGSDEDWALATRALERALADKGAPFEIHAGDGAFYGPKIDIKLKDALGRRWQCSTIQCDFTLPERFDLTYVAPDGQKKRPAMLHRTIFGSLERFIGILIEHYAGAFPVWLSPTQARLLTVTSRADDFALAAADELRKAGFRVETDLRNEKLGYKIREGQLAKIPYLLVIGDQEAAGRTLAVRRRGGEDLGLMPLEEFKAYLARKARVPCWP